MKTSKKAIKTSKFDKLKSASLDTESLKQIKGGGLFDFIKGGIE